MSRIENFIEKVKKSIAERNEAGRIEEMRNHPHVEGCDGTGKVLVDERIITGGQSFGPELYGCITRCTSCGGTHGTGLLRGKGTLDVK